MKCLRVPKDPRPVHNRSHISGNRVHHGSRLSFTSPHSSQDFLRKQTIRFHITLMLTYFSCSVFPFQNQIFYRLKKYMKDRDSPGDRLVEGVITSKTKLFHYEKGDTTQNPADTDVLKLTIDKRAFLAVLWKLQEEILIRFKDTRPSLSRLFLQALPFMLTEHVRFFAKSFMEIFGLNQLRFTCGSFGAHFKPESNTTEPGIYTQLTRVCLENAKEKFAWVEERIALYLLFDRRVIYEEVPPELEKLKGLDGQILENSIFAIFNGETNVGDGLSLPFGLAVSGNLMSVLIPKCTSAETFDTKVTSDSEVVFRFEKNAGSLTEALDSSDLNTETYLTYGPEYAVWCFSTYHAAELKCHKVEPPPATENKQQDTEDKQQGTEDKQQGTEDKQQGTEDKQQGTEDKQQGTEDKQ